jgi:uncharacterized protein YegP (UPF0339 family)
MTRAPYKAEVYRDARGEYRWRVRAANGRIVADSSEGYANRGDCVRMLAVLREVADAVDVVEPPDEVQ